MFVEFAGLKFEAWTREGFLIGPDGFRGASDRVVRREKAERPGVDGSFALPSTLGDRLVEIEGHLLARSPRDLKFLRDRLTGLPTGFERLVVHDGDVRWTWASVESIDVDELDAQDEAEEAAFLLQLWCPDSQWHGDVRSVELSAGGSVPVEARGTAVSWPVWRVTGPVGPGWRVRVGAAGGLVVPHGLASDEVVTVSQGRVVSSRRGPLTGVTGVAQSIPAGSEAQVSFSGSGGSAVVEVTDMWLSA